MEGLQKVFQKKKEEVRVLPDGGEIHANCCLRTLLPWSLS